MTKKEKIFKASAQLFAEQSYDTVGIREIAKAADVNSAMISYYFGGKQGLLKDIFVAFSAMLIESLKKGLAQCNDLHSLGEHTTYKLLTTARTNRDITIVGLKELNRNRTELNDDNKKLRAQSWELISSTFQRIGIPYDKTTIETDLIFTTVMGTIFSDYLLGGGTYIDDDTYFNEYLRIVITTLQSGNTQLW